MGVGAASSTLDRWLTLVRLFSLCGLLGCFCVSLRTGCLWPRRQHRLASAIRISYVHVVGRDLMLASDEVQPQSPYCNPGKRVKELTTENYEKSLKNRFRRIRMQEPS